MATTTPTMTLREWAMLLALSVLWGGSYFFIEIALRALSPLTIVNARLVLAAVALLAVMRVTRTPLPATFAPWIAFVCMGAVNNVIPFTLIVWGQTHIGSGLASILNATAPLFTVLLAHAFTADEKLTGAKIAGVLLGVLGVASMVGAAAVRSFGPADVAQLAVLAAALSYAVAGVYGRRFKAMGVAPLASATGQVICSSIMMLPVTLWVDQPWTLQSVPGDALLAVGALALLSTALAYVLYFRILHTAGATNLLLVTFLIPITAVLLGVLVLGERLQAHQLLGMVLIGSGLAAIDGRPMRLLAQRRR